MTRTNLNRSAGWRCWFVTATLLGAVVGCSSDDSCACGDGGGGAGTTTGTPQSPTISEFAFIDELSTDEVRELCEYLMALVGGPRTILCGESGQERTFPSADECVADYEATTPHCPVGDATRCYESMVGDYCGATYACQKYGDCLRNQPPKTN